MKIVALFWSIFWKFSSVTSDKIIGRSRSNSRSYSESTCYVDLVWCIARWNRGKNGESLFLTVMHAACYKYRQSHDTKMAISPPFFNQILWSKHQNALIFHDLDRGIKMRSFQPRFQNLKTFFTFFRHFSIFDLEFHTETLRDNSSPPNRT